MNSAHHLAAAYSAVLISIGTAVLAISAPGAGASQGGFVATTEIPAGFQPNTANASGGEDRLTVGTFTSDSVSRDVTKTGVKAEDLVTDPLSGASTGEVLLVIGAIVFGFAALLTSTQRRRNRNAVEKPKKRHAGKRRQRHKPF